MSSNTQPLKPVTNRRSSARETIAPHFDLRLRLSQVLHNTLELEELLTLFSHEIGQTINLDSITYLHHPFSISLTIGQIAVHSCSYRLVNDELFLGEIIFTRSKRFSESELSLLEFLISLLILPIRNALKYREALDAALKDPLTGAGNRIAMDNIMSREIDLAKRHKMPLSILMIDLDFFKKINDTHGHLAGDYVLTCLANNIKQSIRKVDMLFRYGGEEFVLLLSNTNIEGALILAERLRSLVENMQCHYHEHTIATTISIGAACLHDEDSIHTLLERADSALYQAKKEKRNRVCTVESIN